MVELPNSPLDPNTTTCCPHCSALVSIRSEADYIALFAEVQALAKHIDSTRTEIAALSADDVVKSHVVTATDELDAIVRHTVVATTTILDACELIDSASLNQRLDVAGAVTAKIYEACSFQDITGQRVEKVVRTLQLIELRISEILSLYGSPVPQQPSLFTAQKLNPLLSGPQQPGTAMDQGAVDALLDAQ